jgi:copper(I)-binding protein
MRGVILAILMLPLPAWADVLTISGAYVPLAPPTAMAHAAYFTLTNAGDTPRNLIAVRAEGYAMAHIHRSEIRDDIATMSPVDVVEIGPGQSVVFEHGGLHVMLMRPEAPLRAGDAVPITLEFADGSTQSFTADVMPRQGGHGS